MTPQRSTTRLNRLTYGSAHPRRQRRFQIRERVESDTIGLSRLTLPDLFAAPQLILGSDETANRAISVPLGESLFSSQDQRIVLVSTGGRGLENGRPDVRMSQGARKERE